MEGSPWLFGDLLHSAQVNFLVLSISTAIWLENLLKQPKVMKAALLCGSWTCSDGVSRAGERSHQDGKYNLPQECLGTSITFLTPGTRRANSSCVEGVVCNTDT